MTKIGLALISLSFLVGAYLTALDETEVAWGLFLAVLAVGVVGVALVQRGNKQEAQDETRAAANIAVIEQSLARLVRKTAALDAEKEALNPYDVGPLIDERLITDLNAFVNARETISHLYGLPAYAEVMTHYAGGERYLNRVWSASADGYIDEVQAYLTKAAEQFAIAERKLEGFKRAGLGHRA